MRTLGNFFWFLLGGGIMGLAWWLTGLIAFISIVGIPWGKACIIIGNFTFFPFGKKAVPRALVTHQEDIGTGILGLIGNLLWLVFAGWWLALGHIASALLCAATIIGIPFAVQHFKLAALAVFPIGKTIVAN